MRRTFALLIGVVGAALWAAGPAHAIETNSFGMEPHPSGTRTSFRIEVRPGGTTTDVLRVWNKTDAPLTLKASATSATVDAAGKVALGGSAGTASWFSFEPEQIELPAKGSALVRFSVKAPRTLDGSDVAAAVTVAPVQGEGRGVAVVQRLATMVYVKTVPGTATGGIGWKLPALILLSVISIGGAVLAWTRPKERASQLEHEGDEEEIEAAPADDEEEAMINESRDDELEVGGVYVSVNDPAVDKLYEAMYEPQQPRRNGQPALQLVVSSPTPELSVPREANEEFAWAAPRKR